MDISQEVINLGRRWRDLAEVRLVARKGMTGMAFRATIIVGSNVYCSDDVEDPDLAMIEAVEKMENGEFLMAGGNFEQRPNQDVGGLTPVNP